MDSKGIDLPGITPAVASHLRLEKRQTTAVRPVEKSGKSMLRTVLDQGSASGAEDAASETAALTEEDAALAAEILASELKESPDLEVAWAVDEETGRLVVEVKHRKTGEVLRQVPPETLLKGIDASHTDPAGLLLDKTA